LDFGLPILDLLKAPPVCSLLFSVGSLLKAGFLIIQKLFEFKKQKTENRKRFIFAPCQ
jgi:hypothetical protein